MQHHIYLNSETGEVVHTTTDQGSKLDRRLVNNDFDKIVTLHGYDIGFSKTKSARKYFLDTEKVLKEEIEKLKEEIKFFKHRLATSDIPLEVVRDLQISIERKESKLKSLEEQEEKTLEKKFEDMKDDQIAYQNNKMEN